ncbi:hypothetical protein [Parafrankia sp. EUN1f]|uniref:hypothetical protein n=1 Tax=Parafrankia sp. EUN1f TaxID=102897 RepID=UPI0001C468AF|nr:hypothetical protein [Parafrankia sp. EUN1f]EFC80526.1 conserved hypothetical protein [Parafrankia sp. EUN1f]
MSEYQYYEFLAVDEPLDADAQAEMRVLSSRAQITATSFVNEYDGGDFGGQPDELVEAYYDAHLYYADWGSRRLLLRLPAKLLPFDAVEPYFVDGQVGAWTTDEHLILELSSEDEADGEESAAEWSLAPFAGLRDELAAGDHRALYLAWLAAYGSWERDEEAFDDDAEDELEPPVPAGLGSLTAPQRELATFLRLDDDLLVVAAESSPAPDRATGGAGSERLEAWVTGLPAAEKDQLLQRVVTGNPAAVRGELLRRFGAGNAPATSDAPRRTVADLLDGAANRRAAEPQLDTD